jgi:hypothetical protein
MPLPRNKRQKGGDEAEIEIVYRNVEPFAFTPSQIAEIKCLGPNLGLAALHLIFTAVY